MDPHSRTALWLALLPFASILFGLYSAYRRWRDSPFRKLSYPPGPPQSGLLRTSRGLPKYRPWKTYATWSEIYGELIHIRQSGHHLIIVNSAEDAIELLDKRAGICSDRPTNPLVKLMGWNFDISAMPYGASWRIHRKTFLQLFRHGLSQDYAEARVREVKNLLRDLSTPSCDVDRAAKRFVAASLLCPMYGYDNNHDTLDPIIQQMGRAGEHISKVQLDSVFAMEKVPFSKYIPGWVPGFEAKTAARKTRLLLEQIMEVPVKFVGRGLLDGSAPTSVISVLLEDSYSQRQYDQVKHVATSSFTSGFDPVVTSLSAFIAAMALFPEVQKKAQRELDILLSSSRLPQLSDRTSLPYVEALYRELLRWAPPFPLNIAHTVETDDIYKGYHIPKGANIVANIWAMTRDESKYPDPEAFKPERFLTPDGSLIEDEVLLTFGFGRRACPGSDFASSTLWLAIASVLATLDIRSKKDSQGNPVEPQLHWTDGTPSRLLPFECAVAPRSSIAKALI